MNIPFHKRDTGEVIGQPSGVLGPVPAKVPVVPAVDFRGYYNAGLDVELVSGNQAVMALETRWRELEEECGNTLFFQT